ncbi:two-component regulator propeller domain-containing protein [Mucilaginibacter gynuensis]|uniref:histidine kinase n=1 Tax=Mucilaginibacter gynuensis TaxID=1302236 RepID=A0ABP8GDD9_9SPHI
MRINNLFCFNKETYAKGLCFLLLFIFGAVNLSPGQSYPYKFNYITVDEGLSHTDANDIVQDKHGYIWVATNFGLDRYDGYSVKKFYNTNVPLNNAFKNRLNSLFADDDDNIWLSTEGGLQCFNTHTEKYIDYRSNKSDYGIWKIYKPAGNRIYGLAWNCIKLFVLKGDTIQEQVLPVPHDVGFSDMSYDNNGLIYLTSNKGLWTLDKSNHFKQVAIKGLPYQSITRISFDHLNNIVLANEGRLALVNRQSLTVTWQFTAPNNHYIKNVVQKGRTDYWVNTAGGDLLRLNDSLKLIQVVNNKSSLRSINSNSLLNIFIDRSECLWVATFGGGVNYCDLNQKLFYTLQHNPETSNSLSGNHIRSVMEDGEDLWIGTTANGLNRFNLKTQAFTHYNTYNSALRLKKDLIASLTLDNDHNLWLGTANGIEILKPGRNALWQPPGYDQFPTYVIETLAKDYYGNIWFGNHTDRYGVIWKDAANHYNVKYYDEGFFIFADSNRPQLLVSSTQGLKRLVIDKEGNIVKTVRYNAGAKGNVLSSDYTYPISGRDNTYWIGTIGGGLNKLSLQANSDAYTIKSYADNYGIFKDVESLEIDNTGNIWMGGNGLQRFDPVSGKLIRYDKNDGLQGNSFKVGSSYKGADGRLYFGGINGLNYFYPDQIKPNNLAARPILTSILINNRKPRYGEQDSSANTIAAPMGYSNELKLNYLQNNFVIFFSSMHFANPLKCKYRYKLVGFDKDWRYTDGKNPSATYSNLNYTGYHFIVEATNNDGIWSSYKAETAIIITPPWWKSVAAKVIYALLVLSALVGIYLYQARWYRLKRELAVRAINEKKKEEMHKQREELYQQQLTFFTNISHEFRTPLTLILGPLEGLITENKNVALNHSYQLMFRNAKRLMNLISELMNFKKVADSIIKLQVQPLLINQFCKDLAWEFQNLATGKGIQFTMTDHTEGETGYPFTSLFDVQVLEKILFNILNNSIKYTNTGGQIAFDVFFDMESFKPAFTTGYELLNQQHRATKYIYFRVADSGIGISAESISKIFDRYYRFSKNHLGSGVGLALVKSLTQLHKGDIYVYSERYKGTEIVIGLPWGDENYAENEKAITGTDMEAQLEPIDNSTLLPLSVAEQDQVTVASNPRKRILLVDDNQELRAFLKQTLEKHYHIEEAEDGSSAIEMASEKLPDLIISDVMMPGMSGIELCKIIKDTFETRHIPFIILSAKDALDTKIEGMESGADYYFSKPLNINLLLLTVNNIFEQAEKLKQRYTDNYLSEATELVHSKKDKEFVQKLLNLIEDNIKDPELDVEFLCTHLYISRTKLYQKIKSISDQSVGDFIRTIRLKKAIQIMTHEDIAMNEVVDRIGFQSSSNFSRAFKKEYGKSPLQYMQALKRT